MKHRLRKSRSTLAVAALAAPLALAGCSSAEEAAQACAELPDYDTRCEQRTSGWSPEWSESQTALPPMPDETKLERIEAPRVGDRYEVFVDPESITRGTDGVMRYSVVVRTPGGVSNAFHEGLRCVTDEVRTYAVATSGGFSRVQDETWRPLADRGPRAYQDYLANVIMCDRNGYAWDADKARRALSAQYTAGGVLIERTCTDQQRCGAYNRSD
jgi:hypothetical protein